MRRVTVVLLLLLVAATPALGDNTEKKHRIDARISSLRNRVHSHQKQEAELGREVAGYTARIRALEGKVGDVSLRLETLEADLALHQKRLDALDTLYTFQSERFAFLQTQYQRAEAALNTRLIDIYESDPATPLDIFLGSRNLKQALDQVSYLIDVGVQDRRLASEVP